MDGSITLDSSGLDQAERFHRIQGNVLAGFNKDFQDFIFIEFKDGPSGRAWIAEIAGEEAEGNLFGSNTVQVLKFNGEFKNLVKQGLRGEDYLRTAWNCLALTHPGLERLGVPKADLDRFPDDFRQGMAARKGIVGDLGTSDPSGWREPFSQATLSRIHAVLIVAGDTLDLLQERVRVLKNDKKNTFSAGTTVLGTVRGRTRSGDQKGHEHFGFKDGVSQPGIRGVTPPDDPLGNPEQGQPGQDLLWPGEFVLGFPTQIGKKEDGYKDGPNRKAGPLSSNGPPWTVDGSYLVFRRLDQDVPAFERQIEHLAASTGLSKDLMGAKLVGRYKSGCPLETRTFLADPETLPAVDPGIARPALADSDSLNNSFEFSDDPEGKVVPLASHVRKAYPRDEETGSGDNSESDTQTHRLMRRGIPFGGSVGESIGGEDDEKRGLLFLCYQKSIEHQFEFVQKSWVNNANFPPLRPDGQITTPSPGQDPLISQSTAAPFFLDKKHGDITVKHFVTTSGGGYFFQPSIDALHKIGAGTLGGPEFAPATVPATGPAAKP